MAERTPEQEVELFTAIYSGVDHLIELLKPAPYDYLRQTAADAVAAFLVLEQAKDDVPDEVLEAQQGMTEALLKMTRAKMVRDWCELDLTVFGLEVGETVLRIQHQAAERTLPAHVVAVSILSLMFLKPELYVETLAARCPQD